MTFFRYSSPGRKGLRRDMEKYPLHCAPTLRDRYDAFVTDVLPIIGKAVSLVSVVLCLAAIAGLVASRVFFWSLAKSEQPGLVPEAFFPNFGKVSTPFTNGGGFTRNDSYGDQLWNELVPIGAGYVRVHNPRQYGLPQSEALPDDGSGYAEMFQASVVHQLHCMGVLRNYTRTYENGFKPESGQEFHVQHCIEYIRQAIICTADTTLEQSDEHGSFNAEDAIHECRDWSLVRAFLEDNRADNDHPGILET